MTQLVFLFRRSSPSLIQIFAALSSRLRNGRLRLRRPNSSRNSTPSTWSASPGPAMDLKGVSLHWWSRLPNLDKDPSAKSRSKTEVGNNQSARRSPFPQKKKMSNNLCLNIIKLSSDLNCFSYSCLEQLEPYYFTKNLFRRKESKRTVVGGKTHCLSLGRPCG